MPRCACPPCSGKPEGIQAFPLDPRDQGRFARIAMAEDVIFPRTGRRPARACSVRMTHPPRRAPRANCAPGAARFPPPRAHRRRRALAAATCCRSRFAPLHGYVAGYWAMDGEIAAARLAAAPAARRTYCLPRAARRRPPALRAVARRATRWSRNRYGIPEPDVAAAALLPAAAMALVVLPLVGFDAARASPRHGRRLLRSHLRVPPRRAGAAAAGRRRVRRPAGRVAVAGTLGRAARRGVHRSRTLHPLRPAPARMTTRTPLLADEVRAGRVLDRRPASASAPNRGPACATTRRATTCAQMQPGDGVLFYHSSCRGAGHRRPGDGRQRGLSGPDAVRPKSRLLRSEEHARGAALVAGRCRASSASSRDVITLDEIKAHADALGEDFALLNAAIACRCCR